MLNTTDDIRNRTDCAFLHLRGDDMKLELLAATHWKGSIYMKLTKFILYRIVLAKCNTSCYKTMDISEETKTWITKKGANDLNVGVKKFDKEGSET